MLSITSGTSLKSSKTLPAFIIRYPRPLHSVKETAGTSTKRKQLPSCVWELSVCVCVTVFHFLLEPFPLWAKQGGICTQRNNSGRIQPHCQKLFLCPTPLLSGNVLMRENYHFPGHPGLRNKVFRMRAVLVDDKMWAELLLKRPLRCRASMSLSPWPTSQNRVTPKHPHSLFPLTCHLPDLLTSWNKSTSQNFATENPQ